MSKPVSPQDYFELMQKMANPAGYPFQSLMFPVLDVKEIDKKISELESVEHWLNANLGLLQLSIKTLQYQKALLTPSDDKNSKATAGSLGAPTWDEAMMNPALWALQMMNQAGDQLKAVAPAAKEEPKPAAKTSAVRRAKRR